MTDQDELRDRIEAVLDRFTGETWENHHQDAAQAIIDEFGLTVEETNAETKRTDENGQTWYDVDPHKMMTRIVGKWETE